MHLHGNLQFGRWSTAGNDPLKFKCHLAIRNTMRKFRSAATVKWKCASAAGA
jgi:hypothetical protein